MTVRIHRISRFRTFDPRSNLTNCVLVTLLTLLLMYSILWIVTWSTGFYKEKAVDRELTRVKGSGQWATNFGEYVEKGRFLKVNGSGQRPKVTSCDIKVVLILCDDDDGVLGKGGENFGARSFERQINQTRVLIKSMLIMLHAQKSVQSVQISIISNSRDDFENLKKEIFENTDAQFLRHLKLEFVPLTYPTGTSWMRSLFRPCATLRLFLPDILPLDDAVLHLDTDIIFLDSIRHLWTEFGSFGVTTLAAMAPCLFHYGTGRNLVPYYGTSGLNAGIMLMNLTRMRSVDWTGRIKAVTRQYRPKIKLADQDILNIYFEANPTQIRVLNCNWNFRPFQCRAGSACATARDGIAAIHGNALSFTPKGPEPLFYAIFQAFKEIKLDSNFRISKLATNLKSNLKNFENSSLCANLPEFQRGLLRQF